MTALFAALLMGGGQVGLEPDQFYWFERQVEAEMRSAQSWGSLTGRQVVLHVPHGSGLPEEKLLNDLDAAIDSDRAALGLTAPSVKPDVYVFPTPLDLGHALGFTTPVSGGLSMGRWSAIVLDKDWTDQTFKAAAAQQLGYVLVHDQLGLFGWPVFNEGIAQYLRGYAEGAYWVKAPPAVTPRKLSQLVTSARSTGDFQEGANFIAYLIRRDKGNPDRLKAVMAEMSQACLAEVRLRRQDHSQADVDEAFKTVYGKGLDALEHDWRAGN